MEQKVLIIDTSVLMVWLKIPDKDTCGPDDNTWDYDRLNQKIEEEKVSGTTFILPMATVIESGNHIAHCDGDRFRLAGAFAELVLSAINEKSPWAAFSQQETFWGREKLSSLIERWKTEVVRKEHSLGDASIVDVANYYSELGLNVEILTGDEGLKAYEPSKPHQYPRPRRRDHK